MRFLSFLVNVYMMLIFIRIILTWFTGMGHNGFQDILARITDPYLNWFRQRFTFLRVGVMDLSPIAALGVLTLVNRVFSTLARYGRITLGITMALLLQALWGAVAFFLGFMIIILVLYLIGQLTAHDKGGSFWRIVDSIASPVLSRINHVFFKDRIVNSMTSVILSIVCMGVLYLVLGIFISIVSGMFARLPI